MWSPSRRQSLGEEHSEGPRRPPFAARQSQAGGVAAPDSPTLVASPDPRSASGDERVGGGSGRRSAQDRLHSPGRRTYQMAAPDKSRNDRQRSSSQHRSASPRKSSHRDDPNLRPSYVPEHASDSEEVEHGRQHRHKTFADDGASVQRNSSPRRSSGQVHGERRSSYADYTEAYADNGASLQRNSSPRRSSGQVHGERRSSYADYTKAYADKGASVQRNSSPPRSYGYDHGERRSSYMDSTETYPDNSGSVQRNSPRRSSGYNDGERRSSYLDHVDTYPDNSCSVERRSSQHRGSGDDQGARRSSYIDYSKGRKSYRDPTLDIASNEPSSAAGACHAGDRQQRSSYQSSVQNRKQSHAADLSARSNSPCSEATEVLEDHHRSSSPFPAWVRDSGRRATNQRDRVGFQGECLKSGIERGPSSQHRSHREVSEHRKSYRASSPSEVFLREGRSNSAPASEADSDMTERWSEAENCWSLLPGPTHVRVRAQDDASLIRLGFDETGAYVKRIGHGFPGNHDLQQGDRVVSINGRPINGRHEPEIMTIWENAQREKHVMDLGVVRPMAAEVFG